MNKPVSQSEKKRIARLKKTAQQASDDFNWYGKREHKAKMQDCLAELWTLGVSFEPEFRSVA